MATPMVAAEAIPATAGEAPVPVVGGHRASVAGTQRQVTTAEAAALMAVGRMAEAEATAAEATGAVTANDFTALP